MGLIVLDFLKKNWLPIVFILFIWGVYLAGDWSGRSICELKEKAAAAKVEKEAQDELTKAIASHVQRETELEAIAAQATRDKEKVMAENVKLHQEGESLVAKNKIYTSCVVPSDGVQYIRDHR